MNTEMYVIFNIVQYYHGINFTKLSKTRRVLAPPPDSTID